MTEAGAREQQGLEGQVGSEQGEGRAVCSVGIGVTVRATSSSHSPPTSLEQLHYLLDDDIL